MKTLFEYGKLNFFTFQWHYYNSEWHLSFLEWEYPESERALFSIGRKDRDMWFVDVLWIRVTPKDCIHES